MTPSAYLKDTAARRQKELFAFLRFPSVSAKTEHSKDIQACAEWLADHFRAMRFQARLMPTGGHPVVYAEYTAGADRPTVLYYGHYDVQPPEPLELWKTPPFEPQIRQGYIYARGASDDKGQTFAHIKGLQAVLEATGSLPVNVKFIVEGEEEIASANLPRFLKRNRKLLKADICVVSDTAQFNKTTPAVTYGLRGIAAAEVYVYGPNRDLHSGAFGGSIANPVNVLCQMIARLHDKNNRVAVPGFYKGVRPISRVERQRLRRLPFDAGEYLRKLGAPALHGEKGFSTYERIWCRPTLDVNGITGGYQGEGSKTIIPAWASAKITMRLVDDMDPNDVLDRLERYLVRIAPKSVRVKVRKYGGARGVTVPLTGPWLQAAAAAIKKGFGKEPVFMREGGSIPVVADFKSILGLDTLLIGFAQSDDNIHSPNERFRVRDFERGCLTAAALPFELARVRA